MEGALEKGIGMKLEEARIEEISLRDRRKIEA